jgi:hypothetical protein
MATLDLSVITNSEDAMQARTAKQVMVALFKENRQSVNEASSPKPYITPAALPSFLPEFEAELDTNWQRVKSGCPLVTIMMPAT